jgi:hypothetical protein
LPHLKPRENGSISTTLLNAHRECSSRKADERFSSLADMHAKAVEYRTNARVAQIKDDALKVVADGNELAPQGTTGQVGRLTRRSLSLPQRSESVTRGGGRRTRPVGYIF